MTTKKEAAQKRWANPEYRRKMEETHKKRKEERLKNPVNIYHKTKIYKLVDKNNNTIYIGSCLIPLKCRLKLHINDTKNKNTLISKKIKECPEEIKIELIETIKCEDKQQKNLKEQEYIDKEIICENPFLLNTNRAHRDGKKPLKKNDNNKKSEYYAKHKQERRDYGLEYYKNNKQKVLDYQKQYSVENREKLRKYNKEYKAKQRANVKKLNNFKI